MKKFFTALLILINSLIFSQPGINSIWYFGSNAGMDFSSVPPTALTNSAMNGNEGCSTISDLYGNLLFYTDGTTIWNKTHQIMQNGSSLNGHPSSTQSGLVVPKPGEPSICYVFTSDYEGKSKGLQYSIVDMTLDGGLGAVTDKNIPLITPVTEKITAVRHSNYSHIWVLTHEWNSNSFYAYLVTNTGLNLTPVISQVGSNHTGVAGNSVGQLKFSPRGNKLAIINRYINSVELFNFNNQTGEITFVGALGPLPINIYGLEFDPKGSRLYVTQYSGTTSNSNIYQYNLDAGSINDINNSKTVVATTTDTHIGSLQLAPDGKIYLARRESNYLGVINNPSNLGTSCNYVNNGFYLDGKKSMFGLPSFIQSTFDIVDINEVSIKNQDDISISPCPNNGSFKIVSENSDNYSYRIQIFSLLGILIAEKNVLEGEYIDFSYLSKGSYIAKISSTNKKFYQKKILIN